MTMSAEGAALLQYILLSTSESRINQQEQPIGELQNPLERRRFRGHISSKRLGVDDDAAEFGKLEPQASFHFLGHVMNFGNRYIGADQKVK